MLPQTWAHPQGPLALWGSCITAAELEGSSGTEDSGRGPLHSTVPERYLAPCPPPRGVPIHCSLRREGSGAEGRSLAASEPLFVSSFPLL